MSEDRFEDVVGVDGPRALPPSLQARLEATLQRIASGDDDTEPTIGLADAPRPVPARARAELEGTLAGDPLRGIDGPRPMPEPMRARLEAAMVGGARGNAPRWLVRSVAVAASLVLLAASTLAVTRAGQPDEAEIPFARGGPDVWLDRGGSDPLTGGAPPAGVAALPEPDRGDAYPSSAIDGGGEAPPPPFSYLSTLAFGAAPGFVAPQPSGPPVMAPRAGDDPIVLAVARGGGAQDEGFFAYLNLLAQRGGVRNRAIEVVDIADTRARRAIATVNLQEVLLGSAPATPVLEHIAAPEVVLDGDVFGFGSPPERQAHLIADQVFPDDQPGATAVIYHTDEDGFADRIPDALGEVLAERGVTVLRVPFDAGGGTVLVPGDAAFLSMRTLHARAWLRQARAEDYRPQRGIAGIYTLAHPDLLPDLPDGTRFVSPYIFPRGDERAAMTRETAEPLSVDLVHGWVTAKAVAVAIWLTDAGSTGSLQGALTTAMAGWENGFAPAYETRGGSLARTPEGVVYRVQDGRFVIGSRFLRDPF